MIRVVADATTLVSALPASSGTLATLIDRWRAGQFQLIVSEPILTEVARAWTKPYWQARLSASQVERAITLLRQEAELTPLTVEVTGVATHPEDDLVLAAAISAQADYLVTGDKQLVGLEQYQGVSIVTPRQFLTVIDIQPSE